ncbi:bromodomain and WD repeat-containing protein 3-like isoform X2 [Dysidea avara]|uniref:bromodomain and WD repeat-containing protein 3-like isoform X2 n=1 Tax=Dysidea avara TaxID=196820 RepID=UPI00331B0F15
MDQKNTVDLSEVYFLIAHFLSDSPLSSAAKVLIEEIEKKKLLPKRLDWKGNVHEQAFSDVARTNSDVTPSHLVSLLESLNVLLNRHEYTTLPGLNSLLTSSTVNKTQGVCVKLSSTVSCVARHAEFNLSHHGDLVGKCFIPSLLTRQYCHDLTSKDHLLTTSTFCATVKKFVSILGHLAPVYCCMFDRTGQRVITGADDCLLKVWSANEGRLLATLRGHSGEVSDISINHNNTLIASGSTDKTIRVWCAQTSAPVAVLTGHHGSITSLQFSPIIYEDCHGLLTSTSSDGHLFIWSYNTTTNEFDKFPIKIMEKTRVGDQTVCSAYSPGGHYFVTGGTDHMVRVYNMYPTPTPEPWELHGHTDRIMIVKFGHTCSSLFATGSRDGTARVWWFKSGQWENRVLRMPKHPNIPEDVYQKHKLQVTMVGWEWTDHYIITASTPDCNLYVWDVCTGTILHTLCGHSGEVFVLEPHLHNSRVLLSAGHDGLLKMWDMFTGVCIKTFHNLYEEEEGESSVFECRFSMDGLSFAATDALGHLILFGFGDDQPYQKFPDEQFFHTDYRPLMWDRDNNVLDEQSQRPPHLMPPPYLVDIDGHPHPLKGQNVVLDIIRPSSSFKADKQEEPEALVDYDEFMRQRQAQLSHGNMRINMNSSLRSNGSHHVHENNRDTCSHADKPCSSGIGSGQCSSESQESEIINHISHSSVMDDNVTTKTTNGDLHSGSDGNVELTRNADNSKESNNGVNQNCMEENQSNNHSSISNGHSVSDHQDLINQPLTIGQQTVDHQQVINDQAMVKVVNGQHSSNSQQISNQEQLSNQDQSFGSQETVNGQQTINHNQGFGAVVNNSNDDINIMEFDSADQPAGTSNNNILTSIVWSCGLSDQEAKNAVSLWLSRTVVPEIDPDLYRLQRNKSDRELKVEVEYYEREMAKATPKHHNTIILDDHEVTTRTKGKSLRSGKLLPDILQNLGVVADPLPEDENVLDNISVSDSEEDDGFNHWSSNEGSYISSSEVSDWTMEAAINITSASRKSTRRHRTRHRNSSDSGEEVNEVIVEDEPGPSSTMEPSPANEKTRSVTIANKYKAYLPTGWLKQMTPKTTPYLPQVGDLVVYCRQGHELYLQEIKQKRLHHRLKGQKLPWQKFSLEAHELCQVKNVHFTVGPPTLCSLTLSLVSTPDGPSSSAPKTFNLKYHDIDDVPDFLIVASHFCSSVCQPWQEGTKFRSYIEDSWWTGKILSREPFSPAYPQSVWQCYVVQWDDDNIMDTLSPWDMEPLLDDDNAVAPNLAALDVFPWKYEEQADGWAPNGTDAEQDRIVRGIDVAMEMMDEATPFKEPVDLEQYPDYCVAVAMPTDLSTIKAKLLNKFYPRKTALLWEVILLYRNTLAYNEDDSLIVKHSLILVQTLHSFINDSTCLDVMSCYQPTRPISDTDIVITNSSPLAVMNDETPEQPVRPKRNRVLSLGDSEDEVHPTKKTKKEPEWVSHAHHLLNTISSHDCAVPFLEPVDTRRFTDYLSYVKQPMDLSTVLSKLESSQYPAPADFIQDIRLIFTNSRIYNSHPKNHIHQMTSTLEEYFEEHVVRFLTKCGGNEIKYATRGAINKVASSSACRSTKRKISSSNNEEEEDGIEEEDDEEAEIEEEEDFDIDDIDENIDEFSSAGDDEIELELEEPLVIKPRKSPRKKLQSHKPMKLRSRSQRHKQQRHRYQSSSAFSNSSDSECEYKGGLVTGSSRKGKGSVIITSHGRRVKPNPKLRHI